MPNISKRILDMQASPIRKLAPFADAAVKKGTKVYHLNIGQPDIKTPEVFFEAVRKFSEPVLKYAGSQGIPEIIDSFLTYYKKWNIDFDKSDIMITYGGSEAVMFSLMAIADFGDNVLVPEPFYTNYSGFCQSAGVKTKSFMTKAENGFHLPSEEEIVKNIDDKTRAMIISNPGNPTGVVYTKEEIELIAKIAKKYDLFIIADEVYREFVYDGLKYTSFMHLEDIADRVILIDSISKRYSACGARIGLMASKNKTLMGNVLKLCQSRLCCPTIEQVAAASLVSVPEEYFTATKDEYQNRRDVVYSALKEMPGVICEKPTGAFYVVAKLPIKNAEGFSKWLLTDFSHNNETVMVAPAEGFYNTAGAGVDEVRISYCLNVNDLKRAMDLFKLALEEYKKVEK